MNTEQNLLERIKADPGNLGLQLMYADWLGEHSDPWCDVWRSGDFCGSMGWEPYEWGVQFRWDDANSHVASQFGGSLPHFLMINTESRLENAIQIING